MPASFFRSKDFILFRHILSFVSVSFHWTVILSSCQFLLNIIIATIDMCFVLKIDWSKTNENCGNRSNGLLSSGLSITSIRCDCWNLTNDWVFSIWFDRIIDIFIISIWLHRPKSIVVFTSPLTSMIYIGYWIWFIREAPNKKNELHSQKYPNDTHRVVDVIAMNNRYENRSEFGNDAIKLVVITFDLIKLYFTIHFTDQRNRQRNALSPLFIKTFGVQLS